MNRPASALAVGSEIAAAVAFNLIPLESDIVNWLSSVPVRLINNSEFFLFRRRIA